MTQHGDAVDRLEADPGRPARRAALERPARLAAGPAADRPEHERGEDPAVPELVGVEVDREPDPEDERPHHPDADEDAGDAAEGHRRALVEERRRPARAEDQRPERRQRADGEERAEDVQEEEPVVEIHRREHTKAGGGTCGDAPGTIRTCDLSLRRRTLYPLSYGRGEPRV